MYPVCLFVLATFLQTTAATVKEPLDRPTFGVVRPVALYDASVVDMRNKEPTWRPPRRELTASGSENCLWDEVFLTCNVNPTVAMGIVRSSESGLANLWLRTLECQAKGTNMTKCFALEGCGWNEQIERCEFVDHLGQYPDSPCLANAPLTFLYSRLYWICPSRSSAKSCSKLDGCTWNDEYDFCYADRFHITFGAIETQQTFGRDSNEVDRLKWAASLNETTPSIIALSEKSDWDSILSLNVPETDCPDGYDQLACDYVDGYLPHLFSQFVYCRYRYQNASREACNADPLCGYTEHRDCIQHPDVTLKALSKADKVLLDLVPDRGDRAITREFLRCGRLFSSTECTKTCRWTGNSCTLSTTFLDQQVLRKIDRNSTDTICLFHRIRLDSGCTSILNSTTCLATENCAWNVVNRECTFGNVKLREKLFEEDPKLEKPLNRAIEKCEPQKNAKVCNKA